ncbi:MAG: hypothetical protein PHO66_01825 [Eubacteriales bacterium]|nr:hypothetical protein [Eubacteriales bacterium]
MKKKLLVTCVLAVVLVMGTLVAQGAATATFGGTIGAPGDAVYSGNAYRSLTVNKTSQVTISTNSTNQNARVWAYYGSTLASGAATMRTGTKAVTYTSSYLTTTGNYRARVMNDDTGGWTGVTVSGTYKTFD